MSTRSLDPLNQLLRQAMYAHRQKVQVQKISPSPPANSPKPLGLYDNPLNWTQGRTISLIHRSPQGSETFLGVFIEMKNERAKVRRWIRDHSPQSHGPALPREVVYGSYWVQSKMREPKPDSQEEIESIRARYRELMREWEGYL